MRAALVFSSGFISGLFVIYLLLAQGLLTHPLVDCPTLCNQLQIAAEPLVTTTTTITTTTLEPLPPTGDCQDCDYFIDARCYYPWQYSSAQHYHRIMQCLVPHYVMVMKARKMKGLRCFVGHTRILLPYLNILLGDEMQWRLVSHHHECVEAGLQYDAVLLKDLKNMDNKKRFKVYPTFEVRKPLAAIQEDVKKYVTKGTPLTGDIILLARRGGMRSFDGESETNLIKAFKHVTKRNVIQFTGAESTLETIRIFALAAGLVGYHGAGFVNSVFTTSTMCVVEITTFSDRDCSDKTVWRSHMSLTANKQPVWPLTVNSHLIWQIHFLSLQRQLLANGMNATNCNATNPPVLDGAYTKRTGFRIPGF